MSNGNAFAWGRPLRHTVATRAHNGSYEEATNDGRGQRNDASAWVRQENSRLYPSESESSDDEDEDDLSVNSSKGESVDEDDIEGGDDGVESEEGNNQESALEEEYRKLTVNDLKQRLKYLELPVSGRKEELIDRLLGRGTSTGKVKEWKKSKAKLLLAALIDDENSRVHSMTDLEVYYSHPWFQNYEKNKFMGYLKTLKSAAENLRNAVKNDEKDVWSDIVNFPREPNTSRGYPFWDTHLARALLEEDVEDGTAEEMKPERLWKSREEYMEFPLGVFCDHIGQEKRKQREKPGWRLVRNKTAQKMHEKEMEERKRDWDTSHGNKAIDDMRSKWEGMQLNDAEGDY